MSQQITIADHERAAMQQLILTARATASILTGAVHIGGKQPARVDLDHATKLRVWAQAVEDVLERVEAASHD